MAVTWVEDLKGWEAALDKTARFLLAVKGLELQTKEEANFLAVEVLKAILGYMCIYF